MELVQEYLHHKKQRNVAYYINTPGFEDLGECEELWSYQHKINELRARAMQGSIRVYANGIMLQEGRDFRVVHNEKALIVFDEYYCTQLNRSMITVTYRGYRLEGDVR